MTTEKLDRTVERLLESLGLSPVAVQARLARSWEEIVGPLLATKTCPARLKAGVLTVCAVSPAWAQELSMCRSALAERIDVVLGPGKVREIRVSVGAVPERADGAAPEEAGPRLDGAADGAPGPAPEPEGIDDVADSEMREILASLSRKARSRRP